MSMIKLSPRVLTRRISTRSISTSSILQQDSWEDAPSTQSRTYGVPTRPKPVKKSKKVYNHPPAPPTTPAELERIAERRILRAERLERKDLTAQLTPTKTYMGGFTQPRHLAFLNPMDNSRKQKDSYAVRVGESRVRPQAEAYEPHLVYLAVTRHPVRWGHGRATRRECFSGFCKESELVDRFKQLNGWMVGADGQYKVASASKEYTELAVWPGSPEARSLANKMNKIALKKTLDAEALEAGAEAVKLPKINILPPVVGFVRPLPPFSDPTLIMPLMTITLPSRPLASTLSRLCNSHPRGLPFYASVPNNDRKDGPSFFRRLLRMRSDRIRELTSQIVDKLEGNGGGFFGLRLYSAVKGRGVEGENLSEALDRPQRGWAVLRWLDDNSEGWSGLERETLKESWMDEAGVETELDGAWSDYAIKVGDPFDLNQFVKVNATAEEPLAEESLVIPDDVDVSQQQDARL